MQIIKSMKKRQKLKKNIYKFILLIAIFLIFGGIGGTIAYFATQKEVKNEFKALTYNVDIVETSSNTFGTKVVNIINKDTTPVVIRVGYIETWSKEDGTSGYVTLNNVVNGTNVVNKEWSSTWQNNFTLGNDGWYYYTKVLKANEQINLINSISLNTSVINNSPDKDDYLSYNYELNFGFEAIQATPDAVKDLWGFNITINNNDIKWFS